MWPPYAIYPINRVDPSPVRGEGIGDTVLVDYSTTHSTPDRQVYISLHGEESALGSQADRYANESLDQISDNELSVNSLQDETQQDKESRRHHNRRRATRRKNATARAQRAPTPHGPRNLRQDLDEADDNAFDSPLINLAEAAIFMQALLDTPQIREIQHLTKDALRQIGRQNPAPSASHNSRTPAKQKGHQKANQGNHPRGQP